MLRSVAGLFAIIALMGGAPSAYAEKRVALVIGNSAYDQMATLINPAPDAKAVAELFSANGFAVTARYDLTFVDFNDALADFTSSASGADAAIIYYAGHGLEVAGKNILAAKDMPDVCAAGSVKRAIPLERLFDAVAGARSRIVLLDACRSDPFPQCKSRGSGQASGFRGLARLEDTGLLIVNATLSGQVADDGQPGDHSPFAKALLTRLGQRPGAPLFEALTAAAGDVSASGRQTPEVILRGAVPRICLKEPCEGEAQLAPTAASARPDDVAMLREELAKLRAEIKPQGAAQPQQTQQAQIPTPPPATPSAPPAIAPDPEVGQTFRECDDCPEMAVVPAGSFVMGLSGDEMERLKSDEGPPHEVAIAAPFAVGRYSVTFAEWDACAANGGCSSYYPGDEGWDRGDHPVINVSWEDARSYTKWLSRKTGKTYRLPSEAEREYFARAGTSTPFWWGKSISSKQAKYGGSPLDAVLGRTVSVKSFKPNPWGIYQVHGNVWEWTADCWNENYEGAPANGSAWMTGDCSQHVVRGGAYHVLSNWMRASVRDAKSSKSNDIGFRVVRTF
jgi:formylglycine-generating enzyme required for sulfatase activity